MSEAKKTYLSKIQLKAELDRCLNCKNQPCMHACPVNCNPQEFINHAKQGAYGEAVKTITRTNPMGQTCGLICPDKFCMQACTRSRIDFAVNIPKVQATILENFRNDGEDYSQTKPKGKNVAVIGAGPAGIAAADDGNPAACGISFGMMQIFHMRQAEFFALNVQLRRIRFSGRDNNAVILHQQRTDVADPGVQVQPYQRRIADKLPVFFDNVMRQSGVGDHVQRAADLISRFKDVNFVS